MIGSITNGPDRVEAGLGADSVDAGVGNDELVGDRNIMQGGSQPAARYGDRLAGEKIDDLIRGDAVSSISTHYTARLFGGDDTIFGGGGNDRLIGGADRCEYINGGSNVIYGEAGDDFIVGDTLDFSVEWYRGDGRLYGGKGNDQLYGGDIAGTDVTIRRCVWDAGFGGNDVLDGGPGDDLLVGGTGSDRLIGGEGADTFVFNVVVIGFGAPAIGSGKDVIEDFGSKDRLDLTSWGLDSGALDSNRDGRVGSGDRNVTIVDGNLVIDLGARTGHRPAGADTVTFSGVSSIALDQIVPRPPALDGRTVGVVPGGSTRGTSDRDRT